jgi:hypothetical protein
MQESELRNSLEIVFEKEKQDQWDGHPTFIVSNIKGKYNINYPHAETLIQLYLPVRTNQRQKALLVEALKKEVKDSEILFWTKFKTYVGTAPLCFYTLVKIGYVTEAIASLKKRKEGCEGLFHLILQILPMNFFDTTQLKDILSKAKQNDNTEFWGSPTNAAELIKKIVNLRYEIFSKKIREINVEINQDKKIVNEKITYLGFDPSYNELLNGIDGFLDTDTEKFINAGMISNLRNFTADLLKDIAHKIAEKEHEKIIVNKSLSEMGNIRKYLKKKLNLSDKENKFVDSFVDILHAEGGHSFMSEKEYFRLARNIAIEIVLFILSKYEKKFG